MDAAELPAAERRDITGLLRAAGAGDRAAGAEVFSAVYQELRRLARRERRRGYREATLSTTALVHEVYLKLGDGERWSANDRSHFFALAARAMRQILVGAARYRVRAKRGGGKLVVTLEADGLALAGRAEELVALDDALEELQAHDAELARLVEWRFFAGLSVAEIAAALEVSDRTVKRQWRVARAFLHRCLLAQGMGFPAEPATIDRDGS
jgi:RNA polymerase sigma factor (TIGR02999 family)